MPWRTPAAPHTRSQRSVRRGTAAHAAGRPDRRDRVSDPCVSTTRLHSDRLPLLITHNTLALHDGPTRESSRMPISMSTHSHVPSLLIMPHTHPATPDRSSHAWWTAPSVAAGQWWPCPCGCSTLCSWKSIRSRLVTTPTTQLSTSVTIRWRRPIVRKSMYARCSEK